jgi:2,4-dienoyl-CoA reductase-like NADH-dependent reductase (Old Yellow Enzyme family)
MVTEELLNRYLRLAAGGVGLIIPGYMHVHPLGRAYPFATGIHSDEMIPGLRRLVQTVHERQAKIFFQLNHAGRQTSKPLIGQTPMGPSAKWRDPIHFFLPQEMKGDHIQEAIRAFGEAARRAAESGADGIQLHAAHGYLINEFLSPFFNLRTDEWGGSEENCFRFLREVLYEVRRAIPTEMAVVVKLSANDYTRRTGITPHLARRYAQWLVEEKIDAIELSCGGTVFSYMNMCRGDVPVQELAMSAPRWQRPIARLIMGRLSGKYGFDGPYNLEAAKIVKPVMKEIPLLLVGGMRKVSEMESVISKGFAEFVSMSRPFIREPNLVNKIREKKTEKASCVSCNKCLAAVPNNMPVRCYNKGFPQSLSKSPL